MTSIIIFLVAYIGIALGKLPGLAIDRVGVAVIGAIAMVVSGGVPTDSIMAVIDLPTILLLYSLMIISAQLRLGGFYTLTAQAIILLCRKPKLFLLMVMLLSSGLSALLANDIVCFAFTPVLTTGLLAAGLHPLPFLLALAIASNIGSAATIIGNPQNMLIGQTGGLHFFEFSKWCLIPTLVVLVVSYFIVLLLYRKRLVFRSNTLSVIETMPFQSFDKHQTAKGLLAVVMLVGLFLSPIPRELSALTIAGILLCSRRIDSREIMGLIDWQLITLFCALFVIIAGFKGSGLPELIVANLSETGINLQQLPILSLVTLFLSNIFSNVPAVILLITFLDQHVPGQWYTLALASTFAGNLFLMGSIANLIVVEQAQKFGVRIGVADHARVGIPVTIASFATLFLWIS
ncbi:SLC13 family permease [Desulfogranum japonicum]|uniref:SLC13 family permease n=1 Tax=Desulfogranum japonicum TaxID=231447 RepID=UPI00040F54B7|nr:SLC13 family permease [Desulfogranum japonicum]